jgi:purine catabolism regulator
VETSSRPLLTVRAALNVPAFRLGSPEVLAGRSRLDTPVRWVHAGEVPNIAALLNGGELLLSTGMGIGSAAGEQQRFVGALHECGVAGFALELGTTFRVVPRTLVREAEARELPLIALRHQVRFVEITEALHTEIVNRRFALLRRGDEIHRRFTQLMLEGAGVPEVLSALARTINNPVALVKFGEGIVYHATCEADDGEVLAAWQERSGDGDKPECIALPVPVGGGEAWGTLEALAIDSPLDEFDRVAIERAVPLIALTLLRRREEEVLAVRERGNFLSRLLESGLDEAEAASRSAAMGFRPALPLMLPFTVALRSSPDGRAVTEDTTWALLWRDVRTELGSCHIPVIAGIRPYERDMLMVVGLATPERRGDLAGRVAAVVRRASERHLGPGATVIAAGAAVRTWSALRDALRETADAAAAARRAPPREWHDATRPDLDRFLWRVRETADLRSLVHRRLGPIVEYDRAHRSSLLETLETYFANGGHKAATARALHLERQSLYNRLDRIQELLGERLDDEDTYLTVHLALRGRAHLLAGHDRRPPPGASVMT